MRRVFLLLPQLLIALGVVTAARVEAQAESRDPAPTAEASGSFAQTQTDAYTRYELQPPDSNSFRIIYDVSATTAGASHYFNPIRIGSEPTVHGVTDLATGRPLEWNLVSPDEAKAKGLQTTYEGRFIQVTLARPVPAEIGQGRIRIDKTYRDAESYFLAEDEIVFERSLGVRRNAVVLPVGYELISCNYPSQIDQEEDGRIRASFINRGPGPVEYRLVGRRVGTRSEPTSDTTAPEGQIEQRAPTTRPVPTSARADFDLSERARQNRDIVYFLQQPESHSFRLYHDYTETSPGIDRYLNVVRPGSRATDPSAVVLDSGEQLKVETLRGAQITERDLDIGQPVEADTEVVAIWFDPVPAGGSTRLRIEETYTDAGRYGLDGEELLWDRSFGRSRNTVLLPPGWYLTESSVPAVIDQAGSGEVRLRFENDRPGVLEVLLRARRR